MSIELNAIMSDNMAIINRVILDARSKNIKIVSKKEASTSNIVFDIAITDDLNDVPNLKKCGTNANIHVILLSKMDIAKNISTFEKEIFIARQVKFRYGKWYDILNDTANKKQLLSASEINNEYTVYYDSSWKITDTVTNNLLINRTMYFIDKLKEFIKQSPQNASIIQQFVFNVDFGDFKRMEDCRFVHNRQHGTNHLILFPLDWYHTRLINFKDTVPFKLKTNNALWIGRPDDDWRWKHNKDGKSHRLTFIENTFDIHPNIIVRFSGDEKNKEKNQQIDAKYISHPLTKEEQTKNKFIINLEGNDTSTSFLWVLGSNCCPLHTFPFTFENILFGNGLEPYKHFIPIAADGSDLLEKYNWCLDHLEECEKIANNGKEYMRFYQDKEIYNEILNRMFGMYCMVK
jgi:hypothetical protein